MKWHQAILRSLFLSFIVGTASFAATQPAEKLRPAYVLSKDGSGAIYYVGQRIQSKDIPEKIFIITMQRSNPGDPFNNPTNDTKAIDGYLRTIVDFSPRNMLAMSSGKTVIQFFVGDLPDLDIARFRYPKATISVASPAERDMLKSIGLDEFGSYLDASAEHVLAVQKLLLGNKLPAERPAYIKIRLDNKGSINPDDIVKRFRSSNFSSLSGDFKVDIDEYSKEFRFQFNYRKGSMAGLLKEACAIANANGAKCVDWIGGFPPLKIKP